MATDTVYYLGSYNDTSYQLETDIPQLFSGGSHLFRGILCCSKMGTLRDKIYGFFSCPFVPDDCISDTKADGSECEKAITSPKHIGGDNLFGLCN